jgi:hypothetical protein
MAEVRSDAEIKATPEAVWKLVGDFGGFVEALGGAVELEGEGIGTLRKMAFGSDTVVERLDECDADAMRLRYSIIEAGPLPVRDYQATMQLTPAADGCALAWSSTFEPAGVSEEDAVKAVQRIYKGGIAGLQRHFAE